MATRKRTTPLKAKTARRTEPKRKARKRAQKETCPVLLAMEEARQLSRNHRLISEGWERQSKARQEEVSAQCDALADRLRGKWEAISHMHAHGAPGALYQILVARHAISWASTVIDADLRAWYRRRAMRCIERAFSTIYNQATPRDWLIIGSVKEWLMPQEEMQDNLLYRGNYAGQKILEERQAAQAAAGAS